MWLDLLMLCFGCGALYFGSEWLVGGAGGLAQRFGIPRLVIGLTIVSLGSSAPEILVTTYSSLIGHDGLALGNVIGSNVCNTFFVLGIVSLLYPLQVNRALILKDLLFLLFATTLVYLLSFQEFFGVWEGMLLLALGGVYLCFLFFSMQEQIPDPDARYVDGWPSVFFGTIALAVGTQSIVTSAISIGETLHVPTFLIGLSVVAIGTSLPEAALSISALYKKESDLLVGNIIGSNLLNLCIVLGLAAVVSPDGIATNSAEFQGGFSFLLLSALICFPLFFLGKGNLNKTKGCVLLGLYVSYFCGLIRSLG